MEFKLGASLWAKTADSQPMAPQQERTEDFGKKLGLPLQQQQLPNERQPQQQWADGNDQERLAAQLQLAQRKGERAAPQVELYGWGSLAGHHLSYLPGMLQSGSLMPAAAQITQQQWGQAAADIAAHAGADAVLPGVATPTAALVALSTRSTPAAEQAAPEQAPLAAFLAQRWPERRLLILPRESGTEVIVRDFHLSADEQQTLTHDLRQFMRSSGEQLEQIWVNGQRVWQREPSQ
jgi:hypothetical protein